MSLFIKRRDTTSNTDSKVQTIPEVSLVHSLVSLSSEKDYKQKTFFLSSLCLRCFKSGITGFTLVELIVVITILAILGTIAFVTMGSFIKSTKDSKRLVDLTHIAKALELTKIKYGYYPDPSSPFSVTYSGALAWTQGSVGDSVIRIAEILSEKPLDPLTKNEYTYSLTNTKTEFQVAAIHEDYTAGIFGTPQNHSTYLFAQTNLFIDQAYADSGKMRAMIRGNYNGKFVKTNSGNTTYILGAPSILTSEIASVDMETILSNRSFVFEGYENIPSTYRQSGYALTGGFDFA